MPCFSARKLRPEFPNCLAHDLFVDGVKFGEVRQIGLALEIHLAGLDGVFRYAETSLWNVSHAFSVAKRLYLAA